MKTRQSFWLRGSSRVELSLEHVRFSFIPISTPSMPFSSLGAMKTTERVTSANITGNKEVLLLSSLKGYVTAAYEDSCWLGYVLKVDVNDGLEVNFLHPKLPAQSYTMYVYPQHQDILQVDPTDILTLVNPAIATGCTYTCTP